MSQPAPQISVKIQQDYRKAVFKAMDYISQNLNRNLSLEEIAREAAYSDFHFHRIFKALVGETLAGFTRRLRMERAMRWLMDNTAYDITHIALESGFSSSQNFAKAFRQHFAMSPSEFRRQKSKAGNADTDRKLYSHPGVIRGFDGGELLVRAQVAQLPARRVAYMRRLGPYGKETCRQAHQDLLEVFPAITSVNPADTLCLYWDTPEITSETRCRTDVCIELHSGEKLERHLATQTIAAGAYAICRFAVSSEALAAAWEIAFRWVRNNKLLPSDGPSYEHYYRETDIAQDYYAFDICIPLQGRKPCG